MIINAKSHENVLALHKNTVEVTCDSHLTRRGDCILAVGADRMPDAFDGKIIIRFSAGGLKDEVNATANPHFCSKHEMVIRKTDFLDDRTFAILADKAAKDIDRRLVAFLTRPDQKMTVEICKV